MELIDILCAVGERYIFSRAKEDAIKIEDRENDLAAYVVKGLFGETEIKFCVTGIYNSGCDEQEISMQALIDLKRLTDMICNAKEGRKV